MKKKVITIVVLLSVVALGIKGKSVLEARKSEVANTALPKKSDISIQVTRAEEGTLSNKESFLAQILSDKSIKLSTKLSGYIKSVMVQESDEVKKGDLLISIDSVELHSTIDALNATIVTQKSDLALAQSIYDRNMKLYKVGGLAKEKLEISKLSLSSKRSNLENSIQKMLQLKHQLSYLSIKAPFDGVVDEIILHQGDLAVAGKPILTMSNGRQKLRFSYAPVEVKQIQKGQSVWLDGKEIGAIRSLYTTSKDGLLSAEVRLKKKIDLPIGTTVNVEVLTKKSKGYILPINTIVHKKDGNYIMVYNNKKFIPLKVDVLMQESKNILISKVPNNLVAYGSEVKLASLPFYNNVGLLGDKDE